MTITKHTFKLVLPAVIYLLISLSFQDKRTAYLFPKHYGYVNDFEEILNEAEEKSLTKILSGHEKQTTNQIAIATLPDMENYTDFEKYCLDLSNHWAVGQKDKNNGVLICVSKNLRQIQIRNGLGIETILTNEETRHIIDENMIPSFKKGDYFTGLKNGVEEIINELKQK